MKNRNSGFTLIELMITVAIVAILAAIALPIYERHVIKTRRTLAKGCLIEIGQFMERQYTTSMSYATATIPATSCISDLASQYTFSFVTGQPTATTYTVNATPIGAQLHDTQCAELGLNQAGVRTVSGTQSSTECWK
jgi:type IV pilus assembly protein PilE